MTSHSRRVRDPCMTLSHLRRYAKGKAHDARIAISSWRYAGNRFQDPICGHRFRRMLPSSSGSPDAWCPRCWSAERHRLLWLYLVRETPITTSRLRVLHFAPERGVESRLRALRNLDYVTADLSPGRAMVQADLTALPFGDHEMDIVLCSHVLEHIPDDQAAIREIFRVLKPGGWAIMQHPIDRGRATTFEDWSIQTPEQRDRAFFQFDHVRIYGRDIEDRFRSVGFAVEMIRYIDRVAPWERDRFRLAQVPGPHPERDLEADMIYLCRVPMAP
jgi:SAM-dependent methyltransferase